MVEQSRSTEEQATEVQQWQSREQGLDRQVQQLTQEVDTLEERLRARSLRSGLGATAPRPAAPYATAPQEEGVAWWQRREEDITYRVGTLTESVQELERRLRALDERRRSLESRPTRPAYADDLYLRSRREEALAQRIQEMEEALYRSDRSTSWRAVFQEFSDMGLTPSEALALARQISYAASRERISVREFHQRLVTALETGASAVSSNEIAGLQAEESRLRGSIVELRRQHEELASQSPDGQASQALQKAGEEAAAQVRESATLLRSQLDALLQDAMDIAGRAAQVDADLRSKEWLGKLLALLEGRKELPPLEVRALGLTLLESLIAWAEQHPESAAPLLKEDLDRALKSFQGWAGSAQ